MTDTATAKIDKFFSKAKEKKSSKGEVIIEANTEPTGIFYIKSGLVRQFDFSPSGQKISLNIFKPGAFFPMSWAINKVPNKYFFECLAECEFRVAPAANAFDFIKNNPDVMLDLLSRVYKGTDGLLARQSKMMGGSTQERLAFELWVYCKRFEGSNSPTGYSIDIKKTELATFTGLTRETISRQLSKMAAQGIIELKQNRIIVRDIRTLELNL